MKNEQFYKVLCKSKINKLIYGLRKNSHKNNPVDLSRCKVASIEEIRPDAKESCVIDRGEDWLKWDYDVDIIAPVYNVGELLGECIRAVIEQKTRYDYRLILVNDGSSDATTLSILDKYRDHEKIIIIDKENGGVHTARNAALDISRGKYITFLDSDDILYDGALDSLIDKAEETGADIIEGAYRNITEDGSVIKDFPHKEGELNLHYDMHGYPWGKVYKRELFYKIRYQRYCFEDSVIKAVVQPLSTKNIGISDYVYGYRRNRASISFKVQGNNKSIDSFWVTKSLYEDRLKLGIETNQEYYEYMLNMVKLTFRRNIHLGDEYQIDLFKRWVDLFQEFTEYSTKQSKLADLEYAITNHNYGLYKLWNTMNMF